MFRIEFGVFFNVIRIWALKVADGRRDGGFEFYLNFLVVFCLEGKEKESREGFWLKKIRYENLILFHYKTQCFGNWEWGRSI